ncbi:MAG: PorV/PorQ family protein [Bacteroidota bacterium]
MRKLLFLLTIGVMTTSTDAQFKRVATTGFAFLEVPVTARYSALGEVGLTLSNAGAEALFTNPALLAFSNGRHFFSISFGNYLAQTQQQALGYGISLGDAGIFGLSIYRLDEGTMTHTENADPNNPGAGYRILGTFNADDIAIGLTYVRKLTDHFSFGGTVKFVQERIAQFRATNELLDFGMIYFTGFRSLRIAGEVQNFGVDARFKGNITPDSSMTGDNFRMPVAFRIGAAMEVIGDYDSPSRLTLAFEGLHPSDYTERLNVGAEYWYENKVALRAGYKFNYDEEGLTSGLGINGNMFGVPGELDVSYTAYGRLGYVLRVSLLLSF